MPQVPLLGQAPSREQAMQAEILNRIDRLAQEIYSRLVVAHMSRCEVRSDEGDHPAMMVMANSARAAAKAYYESLGIRFEE